jgi:hypothetical protein
MKIERIKKKIIYSFVIALVLAMLISGLVYFYFHLNSSFLDQYDKIIIDISDIKNKTKELEIKSIENKKYMELWENITEKKKNLFGIKTDELNTIVNDIADKYSVNNPRLKINIPENFPPNIYRNETLSILYTTGEISFTAYHDVKALQFVNEFIEKLHGYPIISKLEIRKSDDYQVKDYFDISSGKSVGNINGRIIFEWYVFKDGLPNQQNNQQNNEKKQ